MHRLQSGRRYCSAKCGRSETSGKAVRDLNATLLAAKLRACNVAIRALPPRDRMKSNWKQKVAEKATKNLADKFQGYIVTRSFITRHEKELFLAD